MFCKKRTWGRWEGNSNRERERERAREREREREGRRGRIS